MNKGMTLPKMTEVSNNSHLTQELADKINDKFSNEDLAKFHRWLQLVETERSLFAQRSLNRRTFKKY